MHRWQRFPFKPDITVPRFFRRVADQPLSPHSILTHFVAKLHVPNYDSLMAAVWTLVNPSPTVRDTRCLLSSHVVAILSALLNIRRKSQCQKCVPVVPSSVCSSSSSADVQMAPLFIPIRTTPKRWREREREGAPMGGRLRRRKGAGSEGSFGSDLIRVFHDERRPREWRGIKSGDGGGITNGSFRGRSKIDLSHSFLIGINSNQIITFCLGGFTQSCCTGRGWMREKTFSSPPFCKG